MNVKEIAKITFNLVAIYVVGGLLLARAVDDGALSDDILRACRRIGADLADDGAN